ncbi:MAG: polyprenyl diphosphate synthase [Candidatus Njordarchaeia archaeon]
MATSDNSKKTINLDRVPIHIGLIPDGNRRYAKRKKLTLDQSYEIGVKKVKEFLSWCREFNIKYVTIYALSLENILGRNKHELRIIFNLMEKYLKNIEKDEDIHANKVRILVAGSKGLLPKHVMEAIQKAEESTKNYDKYYLILLIGYGGRREIVDAIKKILLQKIRPEEINEETLKNYLYLPDIPYPDLIIRTSGEKRISNFLLWQIAYSELYFAKPLWPEFTREDFIEALVDFQRRERRFGR